MSLSLRVNALVWLVLCAFSLSAAGVTPPVSRAEADRFIGSLANNSRQAERLGDVLHREIQQSGWTLEVRPGQGASITLTPPASEPMDLAFRVRISADNPNAVRLFLTATDRALVQVKSRRTFSFDTIEADPAAARLRFEQTLQSMASEIVSHQTSVMTPVSPKIWHQLASLFLPTAHAAADPVQLAKTVVVVGIANALGYLVFLLSQKVATSESMGRRYRYPLAAVILVLGTGTISTATIAFVSNGG